MNLQLGDRIKWSSAAGLVAGNIVKIYVAKDSRQEYIPYVDIQTGFNIVTLGANTGWIKMMKVVKIS
jgi:hypothetical protein